MCGATRGPRQSEIQSWKLGGAGRIMRKNTSTWRRRLLWFGEFLISNRKPQKRVCWKTLYIFSRLPTWMTWWNTWRSKQNNKRPLIIFANVFRHLHAMPGGVVWCKNDCINSRGVRTTLVLLVGRLAGLGFGVGVGCWLLLVVVGAGNFKLPLKIAWRWGRTHKAWANCLRTEARNQDQAIPL